MRSLAKLGFRRFRQVVMGCFVLMPAIRKNKPNDCQYHIVRVIDCIEGLDNYSLKDGTKINFQLVLPFYGRYKIKWMKSFSTLTEQGFNCFIDDMNSWCEKLPTLDELQNKAAELQLALTEAEHLPSMMDLENKIKVSEEKSNRAKRICSVKDLEPCFLTRERLQKLSKIEDSAVLVKILIGCFVRLTSSVSSETGFEIDKIIYAKLNEQKKSKNDDIILELKFMGTISLTGLIRLVTTINPNEEEFKEWVRKNEGDEVYFNSEEDPLPLNKFVDEKSAELIKILGIPTENFKSNHQSLNHGNNSNVFTLSENFGKEGAGNNKSLLTNFNGVSQTTNEKLTAINFRKCLISMIKISEMISWDKEILARVIKGFFIAIGMKRPEKSSKHQFYIDQIIGVSWGGTPYRIRGNIKTNLRLHLKHLDIITLQDIYRPTGDGFNDDSLNIFIEDMKNWNQSLPSLNFIDSKNREYINAVSKYNNKFNSQSLFTRKDSREMSFLENNQQKFNATRNSPKLTTINPSYEQFQQYLQKQIVSSVRTTPGIGRNDLTVPKFTQQFPLSKSSTFNYFNTPISSEVNWEQQPTSSFSSTINKIKQLNNLRPEQEFWRHHNFISNDFEEVNDPYGSFSAINPSSYYSSPLTIEQEGLMSLSDHATANSSRLYQDMFVAENNFDSPISALQNRYSDTYLPSKRARFSPEAPPVDVFFD
ncbi:hypothetical protein Mgra_00000124 [Meloidogyne graminicola]|uniref:Uncharacterized protein n=2 Tax=Meloidogyne graminicola TaxID=189291 RepID=A0A8T0A382_9BILA|nr:hypothetical protein Mgra_00000124 [Meloidogyne graminicola]